MIDKNDDCDRLQGNPILDFTYSKDIVCSVNWATATMIQNLIETSEPEGLWWKKYLSRIFDGVARY